MDKSVKRKMKMVIIVTAVLAAVFFLIEKKASRVSEISRNSYGEGSKKERYEVTIGEKIYEEPIDIEVQEREYSAKEIQAVFKQTMDKLEKTVLGKNKSANHVEYDLNLITRMEEVPLEITWEINRSDIVNSLGEIQEEHLKEEGELVELKGFLRYGDEECLYILNIMVYPRTLSAKEQLLHSIQELVNDSEENTREEAVMHLPKEMNGESIVWKRQSENKAVLIVMIGFVVVILIYAQEKEKKEKLQKDRARQMEMDYPEIVSQISLLVGTGMTVKNAWKKIISNYQEQKSVKGSHYAYEEMLYTLRQMQGGVSEAECYEHFGKRCGLQKYMKLGTLLSQNIRKGTKGLVIALDSEAGQALEEKKQTIKKRGEETSTKLLLPMSLMLIVVLIIVIVPAFLSIAL